MNLQNMAPNAKRSLLMTLGFSAIAAALYFLAIESTEATLSKTRRALQDRTLKHHTMTTNLSRSDAVTQSLANGAARLAAYEKEMIVPCPMKMPSVSTKATLNIIPKRVGRNILRNRRWISMLPKSKLSLLSNAMFVCFICSSIL